jgi:hypothetical protein
VGKAPRKKLQIPNTKLQRSSKLQTSNLGAWYMEFLWSLDAWVLELKTHGINTPF